MYVCKDSAAPARARTRAHRPAASPSRASVSLRDSRYVYTLFTEARG